MLFASISIYSAVLPNQEYFPTFFFFRPPRPTHPISILTYLLHCAFASLPLSPLSLFYLYLFLSLFSSLFLSLSSSLSLSLSLSRYNHGHLIRFLASMGADLNQEESEHCYSPLTLSLVLVQTFHPLHFLSQLIALSLTSAI